MRFEVGRLIEDLPFTVRALYFARKVVTAPGAYYKYNYVPQSIMTDTDPEMRRRRRADYRHSKELVRKFAKEHGFTAPCTWRDPMYIVYEMRRFWWKFMQFVHYKGLKKIENQI